MNGPSISRSAASTTGMLTAFVTRPPSSAATICSATISPARSCASSVEAARCGVTTTSSSSSSGPVYGSVEKTSSAAPASLPERIASTRASSSTSAPRAALIEPRAVAHRRDRLPADDPGRLVGQRQVQRDEVGRAEHAPRASARARCRPRGTGRRRRTGRRRPPACPSPTARRATCWPIRPRPRTPSVLSASSIPLQRERSQVPCFSAAWACGMLRASATSRPIVCSAAETTVESGAFATTIPRWVAASTSTLSTPTPARPITFSRSARAISVRGQLGRRADHDRVVAADGLGEIGVAVDVDVEVARGGARRPPRRSAPGRAPAAVQALPRPAGTGANASSARVTPTPRSISAPASTERARRRRARSTMSKTS